MFVQKFCTFLHRRKQRAAEERGMSRVSQEPIPASQFLKEHRKRCRNKELLYEFKAIEMISVGDKQSASIRSEGQHKVAEAAKLECNQDKNLTARILPYERNIVRLSPPNCCQESEIYINASWIDGAEQQRQYIAAQGPLADTKNEFWWMVWQHRCQCIVMATNLFEHARQQCDKYWHHQHCRYGLIDVWQEQLYTTAEYELRHFRLEMGGSCLHVRQYQFRCWSLHDTPRPAAVIEVRRKVTEWMKGKTGPLLVHCSDGASRTGTYICIDAQLQKVEAGGCVDILQQTLALRKARPGMVGNPAQYRCVYDTVCAFVARRPSAVAVADFPDVWRRLRQPADDGGSRLEAEFRTIAHGVPSLSVGECAAGHRAENRSKSRDVLLQPPERARPYLATLDGSAGTDFINAVCVDGHCRCNQYIVTQWPLKNTVADFWKLIIDHNVGVVIVLSDCTATRRGFPKFWAADRGCEVQFGSVTAMLQDEFSVTSKVLCRQHCITKATPSHATLSQTARSVTFLFLSDWCSGQPAEWPLLELLMLAEEANQAPDAGGPILLVSDDGMEKCGVLCALHICADKLRFEGEIDLPSAVQVVKRNRPQLVGSLAEYKLCYSLANLLATSYCDGILKVAHDGSMRLRDLEACEAVRGLR